MKKENVLTKGFIFALFAAVAAIALIVLLARAERTRKEEAEAQKRAYLSAETTRAVSDAQKGIKFSPDWSILERYPSSLTEETYTVPGCVSRIAPEAFAVGQNAESSASNKLTSVTLPPSVTMIGEKAFLNQTSLKTVNIPAGVRKIGEETFANTGLTSVVLPEGVIGIDQGAFRDCRSLSSVTLPNSLTVIGNGAFQNCSSLKVLVLPANLLRLSPNAFDGCDELKTEKQR